MKTVGIFEAKTRFTALCDEVVRSGEPTLVSKRGKPLVLVSPIPHESSSGSEDILTAWTQWEEMHPNQALEADFPDVNTLRGQTKPDPRAFGLNPGGPFRC